MRNIHQIVSLSFLPIQVTPLSKRVYSESNDQEMDIWLQVTDLDVNRIKTSNVFMMKQFPAGRSSRGLARAQDPLPHGDAVHEVLQKGGQETQVYRITFIMRSNWWQKCLSCQAIDSGAVLLQAGNASERNCSVTGGSTAPCLARNPWTRPPAQEPQHLQSPNQQHGRTPACPQWQVIGRSKCAIPAIMFPFNDYIHISTVVLFIHFIPNSLVRTLNMNCALCC